MKEEKMMSSLLYGSDKHLRDFSILRPAQLQATKGEWQRWKIEKHSYTNKRITSATKWSVPKVCVSAVALIFLIHWIDGQLWVISSSDCRSVLVGMAHRHKNNKRSSHRALVSTGSRSLCTRRKTRTHRPALPLRKNGRTPGRSVSNAFRMILSQFSPV